MPSIYQINVVCGSGSTGKIVEQIGTLVIKNRWKSFIACGRNRPISSNSVVIRVGNDFGMNIHALQTRIFDNHGLASNRATKKIINNICSCQPDIIHIHNIHGYYLNYKIFFDFLKEYQRPIVWTLHDCWPITGHCAYPDLAMCSKWKKQCYDCPQKKEYPSSLLFDRSHKNYLDKKKSFIGLNSLYVIPVSKWLEGVIRNSYLNYADIRVIHNGIDLELFKPCAIKNNNLKFKILGVSNVWDDRKGLNDFIKLRGLLPDDYEITLVGLNAKQIKSLPTNINGIGKTNNQSELAALYSNSDVFVNPTYADTFPTVNIESLACGTPVITYNTGGSPEIIDISSGLVVEQGNVEDLADAIRQMREQPLSVDYCRKRAELLYNKNVCFEKYLDLYKEILKIS